MTTRWLPAVLVSTLSILSMSGAGCSASRGATFPTRAEIDKLAATPPPLEVSPHRSIDVDTWDLSSSLPDAIEVAAMGDLGPWGAPLAKAASARPGLVLPTRAMTCVAREAARFVAEKGAMPAEPLRDFMAARCGTASSHVAIAYQAGSAPASMSEADLVGHWSKEVQSMVRSGTSSGNLFAGIAFARKGERAAVVLVTQPRRAHVEKVPLLPVDGKVVIQGELLAPAGHVEALVNRGRFGYTDCTLDINVALPRFAAECPVSTDDPSAWIEIAAFPPGRVLGEAVVEAQVFPKGTLINTYTRVKPSSSGAARDRAGAARALLARLNATRKEAGLGEVQLSAAQSKKADLLAPHYFAALAGVGDVTVADTIALGLRAGWDVEGVVREGHFATTWGRAEAPDELLERACAKPFGRRALLDPDASVIAIGSLLPGEGELGAVMSAYSLLDPAKAKGDGAAMAARLAKLRRVKKLDPTRDIPELTGVMAKAAERVQAGSAPSGTLRWLMEASAEQVRGMRVLGWVAEAGSIDKIDIPSEILSQRGMSLAVSVAHYKPEGEPWARLVVFFVTVAPADQEKTAGTAGLKAL